MRFSFKARQIPLMRVFLSHHVNHVHEILFFFPFFAVRLPNRSVLDEFYAQFAFYHQFSFFICHCEVNGRTQCILKRYHQSTENACRDHTTLCIIALTKWHRPVKWNLSYFDDILFDIQRKAENSRNVWAVSVCVWHHYNKIYCRICVCLRVTRLNTMREKREKASEKKKMHEGTANDKYFCLVFVK